MTSDILIKDQSSPKQPFLGKLNATGLHISGKAALSYKITNELNKETWIGVIMLELPLSGHGKGYWLTNHNDPDPKSSGVFAMGDINLKRNQGDIQSK